MLGDYGKITTERISTRCVISQDERFILVESYEDAKTIISALENMIEALHQRALMEQFDAN